MEEVQKTWTPGTFDELAGDEAQLYRRRGEIKAVRTTGPFALIHRTDGPLQAGPDWEGYVVVDEHGFISHMEAHTFDAAYTLDSDSGDAATIEELRAEVAQLRQDLSDAAEVIEQAAAGKAPEPEKA